MSKIYRITFLLIILTLSLASVSAQKLEDIEGIGPVYAEKLKAEGVKTQQDLLTASKTKAKRDKLSEKTGISSAMILKWVNRADLATVKGIGPQYADLLEKAGVDSPKELSLRNAANLAAKLKEVNDAKKSVKKVPSEKEVQKWIDAAKKHKGSEE